jgi:NADPH:quinone reductase-like Zn-dependent oxidoreductase
MKSIIFEKAGRPEEVLQLKEIPTPTPAAGEVLVKVMASPVNPSDVMFVQGMYGIRPQLPSGAGFEGCGIIEAVGEGVNLPVGSRVAFTTIGAWSEYAVVSAKAIFPLPPTMPFEVGAQIFVNPFTAWAMLHDSGLQQGQWLILTAGGSTFAQLVIQMAAAKGIKVICTVRRDSQTEQLLALGAAAVVNTEKEFLPKRVKELTNGAMADCCFDATGGDVSALALNSLKAKGKMFVYGMLSLKETPVNNGLLIFKGLTIQGFWLTEWLGSAPREVRQKAAQEIIALLHDGTLKVQVAATYPLENAVQAVTDSEKEGRSGKILITTY